MVNGKFFFFLIYIFEHISACKWIRSVLTLTEQKLKLKYTRWTVWLSLSFSSSARARTCDAFPNSSSGSSARRKASPAYFIKVIYRSLSLFLSFWICLMLFTTQFCRRLNWSIGDRHTAPSAHQLVVYVHGRLGALPEMIRLWSEILAMIVIIISTHTPNLGGNSLLSSFIFFVSHYL